MNPEHSLADIVNMHPSLARELERRGLDYCCGGATPMARACVDNGLDPGTVLDELRSLVIDEPVASWSTMGLEELVDHLESTHHRFLWDELPRLSALMDKVLAAHGANHPELIGVQTCFESIRTDLEPHLIKEEQVLFPMVRELATASAAPTFGCGSIENPISVMLTEHDTVGSLLQQLRTVTDDYTIPPDGCPSYDALFTGFEELEADTHMHIHKENNVLFPAVVELERGLTP